MLKLKSMMLVFILALFSLPALTQDEMTPSVTVDGQVVVNGTVRVDEVVSDGPGFIVIHATGADGNFGEVIGHTPVADGVNTNVVVNIDVATVTPTLFAMLHTDDGEIGTYEFGTVPETDGPVIVNEVIITPTFPVEVLSAHDQIVDGAVMIHSVTMSADGFVVIHATNEEGNFGEVIGFAPVTEGTNTDVMVELDGEATDIIWPMLHFDTNEMGTYEFGTVEGADAPVVIDGAVATLPIWIAPHIRVPNQIVLHGDGIVSDMMTSTVHVGSVLSDGPGFIVIHAATAGDDGSMTFGEVLGFAPVEDGLSIDVMVELDGAPTAVLYPMLHTDDGEIGTYEFGTVEGADAPVVVNGNVVTFPINAAPSIAYSGTLQGTTLTIEQAVIDAPGWLVIHADNGSGSFGEVIGQTYLPAGISYDVEVELDASMITDPLYPMLHYDTGEEGVYEFGTVEGADSPVAVSGNVVVAPMNPAVIQ